MLRLKHVFKLSGFKSHMIYENLGGGFSPPLTDQKKREASPNKPFRQHPTMHRSFLKKKNFIKKN
jgi:hypothetical protein